MNISSMNRSVNDILEVYHFYSDVLAEVIVAFFAIGVISNSLVIAVYIFQMKQKAEERYFVPILAMSNLFATIIGSAHGLIVCFELFSLKRKFVWEMMIFLVGFISFMSILLLICIAVQRYMMVCRNTKIPLKWLRIMVTLSFGLAFSFALPLLFSFEIAEFTIENVLIGTRPTNKHHQSQTLYGVVAVLFVIIVYLSLLILYGKICCKLYGHRPPSGISRISSEYSNAESREEIVKIDQRDSSSKRRKRYKRIKTRFTLMFVIITSVFLICFIPQAAIMLLEGLKTEFWESLTITEFVILTWTTQMYMVNNIINPFVYAFMDSEFRDASRHFFRLIIIKFGGS